jgi:hypothetical protein
MAKGGDKIAALAVALVSATVLVACGTSNEAEQVPAAVEPQAGPVDIRKLLVPPGPDHPAVGEVIEVSFADAIEQNLFASPPGMVTAPDSCVNYLQLGDPRTITGWMQYNQASPVGKTHDLRHEDFFVNNVVELPAPADLDAVRAAAVTACGTGTVTLDGALTGTLVNTEVSAPGLDPGRTLAMLQRIEFAPAASQAQADLLRKYYGAPDPDGGIVRDKHIVITTAGNVLYFVIVHDADFATQMAQTFHAKATAAGL